MVSIVFAVSCFWFGFLISTISSNKTNDRRSLILKVFPVFDLGSSSLLERRTVYGCLVKTWETKELFPPQLRDVVNKTNIYQIRQSLFDSMQPIPILQWPAIEFRSCPSYQHSGAHRSERGHGASHVQVWLEFSFFDHDVNEARFRFRPEYITSTSYSSVSGVFQATENGTLIRNGQNFLDDDFIIVFEDALSVTPTFNLTRFIHDIRQAEPFDILPLMNCSQSRLQAMAHSGSSSPTSHNTMKGNSREDTNSKVICLAAYAIKRKAAHLLGKLVDICGRRIEQQLLLFASEGFIKIGKLTTREPYFVDFSP